MGGDIYKKGSDKLSRYPKFCQKCQKERANKRIINYSWKYCAQADCPSYAINDPNFDNLTEEI
jgi:hypothetical protein